jgi:hypothetical protein
MTERNDQEIQKLLKQVYAPVRQELRHDLWPEMRRRLEEGERRLPWFDWALAGAILGAVAFFPQLILVIVYHL